MQSLATGQAPDTIHLAQYLLGIALIWVCVDNVGASGVVAPLLVDHDYLTDYIFAFSLGALGEAKTKSCYPTMFLFYFAVCRMCPFSTVTKSPGTG